VKKLALVGLVFGVAGAFAWARLDRAAAPALRNNAKARADAARKVYEGLLNRMRMDAGFKLDSDALYLWSRRWMNAQREVAASKAERTAAAEAHRTRPADHVQG
jgi:hypothetical protein